jgi:hypothetical protein
VTLPILAEVFEAAEAPRPPRSLRVLNGPAFYGLPPNDERITLAAAPPGRPRQHRHRGRPRHRLRPRLPPPLAGRGARMSSPAPQEPMNFPPPRPWPPCPRPSSSKPGAVHFNAREPFTHASRPPARPPTWTAAA